MSSLGTAISLLDLKFHFLVVFKSFVAFFFNRCKMNENLLRFIVSDESIPFV